eukprot:8907890-Pyramimonas_sp.AAC.1
MIPPLRRDAPQAIPPWWSARHGIPPWRGHWGPRIRTVRALIAVRASTAGARARMSARITASTTTA